MDALSPINKTELAAQSAVLVDTGAGINLTHNEKWLTEFEPVDTIDSYFGVGAQDTPIAITGFGYLNVKTKGTDPTKIIAFCAPEEDDTLISAIDLQKNTGLTLKDNYTKLANDEYEIPTIIKDNTVWVKTRDLINVPQIQNTLRHIKPPAAPSRRSRTMSLTEAHMRLNHANMAIVKASIKNGIFDDIDEITNDKHEDCVVCALGKSTRHPHYKGAMNLHYTEALPGASWSLDLFGPVQINQKGAHRFMLIMVDSVSRYMITSTHPTKDRFEIKAQIQKNIANIERQFNRTVKELRMDQGKEFDNSELIAYLDQHGIKRVYTTTQEHAGNARAERAIRTITTDIRTLLCQTKIPARFWRYAVTAATDVRNCTLNNTTGEAPIKAISKEDVKIYLRSFLPFGTMAIVWQPESNKQKPTGQIAVTLCKNPFADGYWFYLPGKHAGKAITSANYRVITPRGTNNDQTIDYQQYYAQALQNSGTEWPIDYDEEEIMEMFPEHLIDNRSDFPGPQVDHSLTEDNKNPNVMSPMNVESAHMYHENSDEFMESDEHNISDAVSEEYLTVDESDFPEVDDTQDYIPEWEDDHEEEMVEDAVMPNTTTDNDVPILGPTPTSEHEDTPIETETEYETAWESLSPVEATEKSTKTVHFAENPEDHDDIPTQSTYKHEPAQKVSKGFRSKEPIINTKKPKTHSETNIKHSQKNSKK
ncbi:gag-pol fusion protein [Maudiozyma humilis]|uniref:Gag-pol fusion protein n=1 Tax=Maudiozyma humilis TaxID=51915 RepID=A0AAV5RYF7_MAUHU|nr:gag-pol fusion protein [Kazachstania humilis]